jgi:hypothetical protein
MISVRRSAALTMFALLWSAFATTGKALGADPITDANKLVTQHLDSIASSAIRAGLKTRVVHGPLHFRLVVGGAGSLEGKSVLVSDGEKFQFMMKLASNDYDGERVIFDGRKDSVAFSAARQRRSALGQFVFGQDAVIREGLLGGTLSTAWPLLTLDERKPKLTFEGLKKMEGQELYKLSYLPHKSTDLKIELYFDPETCRHVETVYRLTVSPTMVSTITAEAQQTETRYVLQERFGDFKTVDGVTLPTHYTLQFSQEAQSGRTVVSEWDMTGLDVSSNMPVDSRNFEVK